MVFSVIDEEIVVKCFVELMVEGEKQGVDVLNDF